MNTPRERRSLDRTGARLLDRIDRVAGCGEPFAPHSRASGGARAQKRGRLAAWIVGGGLAAAATLLLCVGSGCIG